MNVRDRLRGLNSNLSSKYHWKSSRWNRAREGMWADLVHLSWKVSMMAERSGLTVVRALVIVSVLHFGTGVIRYLVK